MQKFGSAISYLKRYSAAAMFAVVDGMDDDAEAATAPQRAQTAQRTTKGQNGASAPAEVSQDGNPFDDVPKGVRTNFHEIGSKLYGEEWDTKRHEIVKAVTKDRTESSTEITESEMRRLTASMAARLAKKNQPDAASMTEEDIPF